MVQLPPLPPGVDLTQNRGPDMIVTSVVTWSLAVTAVVLRIISRQLKCVHLWIDDWLIVASLVPSCAHVFGMSVYAVSQGMGKHIWANPPDALYAWAIGLFIAELGYFITLMCVKWSILAFYWRSFNVRESVQIPIITLAVIVLLWGIAVILVTIFQCVPANAWWDRFHPTHPLDPSQYQCRVESTKFFYGNAIPTIVTDVAMLALPIPYILRLQLPKGQKMALAGIFCVGLFVTVVSIVRFHYLLRGDLTDPDITWNFVDIALWSVVEGNIAIVCSCLPFLRPVLSKVSFGRFNLSSFSTRRHGQSSSKRKSAIIQEDESRMWEGDGRFGTTSAHVRAFSSNESYEQPFSQLTRQGSDQSLTTAKQAESDYELNNVPGKRAPEFQDRIVVTKEVCMRSQDV